MCECVHTYAHTHIHIMIVCTCLGAEWKVPNEKGGKIKAYILAPNMGLEFPSSTQENWKQQQTQQQKHSYGS